MTHPELTAREFQVLRHLAAGGSNKEIGQKLFITEHTVKAHVKSILIKLDAMDRTQAIAIATKRGLLPNALALFSVPLLLGTRILTALAFQHLLFVYFNWTAAVGGKRPARPCSLARRHSPESEFQPDIVLLHPGESRRREGGYFESFQASTAA